MARPLQPYVEPETNKKIGSMVASLEYECKVCKHSLLIVCLYYRTLPEYEKAATFLDILVCLKILPLFVLWLHSLLYCCAFRVVPLSWFPNRF